MAIERFEVGKKYRWVGGSERPSYFESSGMMDFLLDGKPHECLFVRPGNTMIAAFDGSPKRDVFWASNNEWALLGYESNFEEVIE